MRKIIYSIIGLFFLSLLFTGSSFADTGKKAVCSDSSEAMMLLGTSLYTPTGVYIGDVTDLAINSSTGQIDSVLVNRMRDEGARVVAIPFADISRTGENTFVYNPPESRAWALTGSYYGETPYDVYGFGHLPAMPQGDQRFSELVQSRQCG
jgi:sporulation protein YlmC with PRC-barrel domain